MQLVAAGAAESTVVATAGSVTAVAGCVADFVAVVEGAAVPGISATAVAAEVSVVGSGAAVAGFAVGVVVAFVVIVVSAADSGVVGCVPEASRSVACGVLPGA